VTVLSMSRIAGRCDGAVIREPEKLAVVVHHDDHEVLGVRD